MRSFFLIGAFAMSASALAAENIIAAPSCESLAKLSRSVMKIRQDGVPLSVLMNSLENLEKGPRDVGQLIVAAAYHVPRYTTPEAVRHAIEEFENGSYLSCFNGVLKSR